jgi:predicted nucleic acid-binding protein
VNVYLDTSAISKLLIDETGSDEAAGLWGAASRRLASIVTYVELRAALAAASRAGRVRPGAERSTRALLERCWAEMEHIAIDDTVVAQAGDLAERHRLRGYDAVHLATGVEVGGDVVFVTWDRTLAAAATANGLAVAPRHG